MGGSGVKKCFRRNLQSALREILLIGSPISPCRIRQANQRAESRQQGWPEPSATLAADCRRGAIAPGGGVWGGFTNRQVHGKDSWFGDLCRVWWRFTGGEKPPPQRCVLLVSLWKLRQNRMPIPIDCGCCCKRGIDRLHMSPSTCMTSLEESGAPFRQPHRFPTASDAAPCCVIS